MSVDSVRIRREDGEFLVLHQPDVLAHAFFQGDPSSLGEGAFDQLAGTGSHDRIVLDDVMAINRTMRARSPHSAWASVVEGDSAWLAAIPPDLDLLELDEEQWGRARGDEHLSAGFSAVLGPGRGLAVATKVLHLKRPRLFPVLDSLVSQMLGVNVASGRTQAEQLEVALHLARAIRREGRRNIDVLRQMRDALTEAGVNRPLVRIFDALLWFSHPAAGVPGALRRIEITPWSGARAL